MEEKKTDIENQTFQIIHHLSVEELNTKYMPNNEMIKVIMKYMFEEFKIFLDKEYNLNERYFKEGLFIKNIIRFIPESTFFGNFDKSKRKSVIKAIKESTKGEYNK